MAKTDLSTNQRAFLALVVLGLGKTNTVKTGYQIGQDQIVFCWKWASKFCICQLIIRQFLTLIRGFQQLLVVRVVLFVLFHSNLNLIQTLCLLLSLFRRFENLFYICTINTFEMTSYFAESEFSERRLIIRQFSENEPVKYYLITSFDYIKVLVL